MTPGEAVGDRELQSRREAIEYVESLLPDLVILASSQPRLRHALEVAHAEARAAVRGFAEAEREPPPAAAPR